MPPPTSASYSHTTGPLIITHAHALRVDGWRCLQLRREVRAGLSGQRPEVPPRVLHVVSLPAATLSPDVSPAPRHVAIAWLCGALAASTSTPTTWVRASAHGCVRLPCLWECVRLDLAAIVSSCLCLCGCGWACRLIACCAEASDGTDRYHFNAVITQQDAKDTYLPIFQACVQRGNASGVMCRCRARALRLSRCRVCCSARPRPLCAAATTRWTASRRARTTTC